MCVCEFIVSAQVGVCQRGVCVFVQSCALVSECLIHQPLSDMGDEPIGISSSGYILITVS